MASLFHSLLLTRRGHPQWVMSTPALARPRWPLHPRTPVTVDDRESTVEFSPVTETPTSAVPSHHLHATVDAMLS
jgi:hypothetical protein